LVGAPPGYVGYDEGGQLTEAVRRRPYSIILLDEIEKAHSDVFNILLQVLDDGRLTDNKGRLVNFKNTLIIMTTNMGASIIQENFDGITEAEIPAVKAKTQLQLLEFLKQQIRPEFLNRIDEQILFTPLTKKDTLQIVEIQINNLKEQLEKQQIHLVVKDEVMAHIAETGYDPHFGARPVKRVIQKEMLNELSKELLAQKIDTSQNVIVDLFDGKIVFRKPISEEEEAVV
jgi:ATP-dependent Clp protease ATP-binding subunit ClpB